ncbi:phosphoribosyltransferase [Candidatus Roizmanbacteria bacterium]|nr:phosphoribosyltransferase [Candidatus Roizmanbacteria bacterium]
MKLFENREEAGRTLGKRLKKFKIEAPIILAMPRGGVPVGFEVAKILKCPLDVIIARKIGAPNQPELGIGAIAEGNVKIWDREILKIVNEPKNVLDKIVDLEKREVERRKNLYRNYRPIVDVCDKTVILVDDGVATGITAKASIYAIKKLNPKKIIFASPVCSRDSVKDIKHMVDNILCLMTPEEFNSVGQWYENFDQTTDEEVKNLLKENTYSLGVTP